MVGLVVEVLIIITLMDPVQEHLVKVIMEVMVVQLFKPLLVAEAAAVVLVKWVVTEAVLVAVAVVLDIKII